MNCTSKLTLILIFSVLIANCEKDTNLLNSEMKNEPQSYESDLKFVEKSIEGQLCNIYYSDVTANNTGWKAAPSWVLDTAVVFIKQMFGDSLFNTSLQLRSSKEIPIEARSSIYKEKYVVTYNFNVVISDFSTNCIVGVYLDSSGIAVRQEGIFDFKSRASSEKLFNVTDTMAVRTAIQYGLESSLHPWIVEFYYCYGDIQKYVWIVTISRDCDGRSLFIDTDKPEVIDDSKWITCHD